MVFRGHKIDRKALALMNRILAAALFALVPFCALSAQQSIVVGSTPNDGTGDPLRTIALKVNSNTSELYALVGAKQPFSFTLSGIAALAPTTDQIIYATGPGTFAVTSLPAFARGLISSSTAAIAQSTLGLGGAAVLNVGTTPGTVADGGALSTETTRATAVEAMKAAKGANNDITSLSGLTTPLSGPQGGTGYAGLSLALDGLFSSTQGAILYRGASGWAALAPNTAGYVLTDGGVGGIPSWAPAGSGGGGSANAVLYTAQSLTSSQQLQARQNIAAVASGDTIALGSGSTAVTPAAGDNSTKVATTAFVANASGGAATLVASGSASAAATTDIALPAGFKRFIVKITGLSLSATGTFNAQLSNSGSGGVRAGASDYYSYAMSGGSAGNPVSSSGASSSFQIFAAALTNSGYGYNADFILYPGTSTLAATAEGKGDYVNSATNRVITTFGLEFQGGSLGRANLIRLLPASGGTASFDYSVLGEN